MDVGRSAVGPPNCGAEQVGRWAEVLDHLHLAVARCRSVVVDGHDGLTTWVADRLAERLLGAGRACRRLTPSASRSVDGVVDGMQAGEPIVVADGPGWRRAPGDLGWDVVIWLRTPPPDSGDADDRRGDADIVVDVYVPAWPVIRHVAARLGGPSTWYVSESRAFFAIRASTWDTKFGADQPAYAAAVAEAQLSEGGTAIDVGCGTGRALQSLRRAVGWSGTVIGIDLTPQMLAAARQQARDIYGTLILGDALRIPIRDAAVDAVFAAGLITHLPDAYRGMHELARVTRTRGRLVLFHPSGRAALAARHGRTLRPDEPLAEAPLRSLADETGWSLRTYDDSPHRFLAIAERR
jgi:SAM-dependent methyltransferase